VKRKSTFFDQTAEICKTLRKQRGVTQPELSEKTGLSLLHIQNIENGKPDKIKMDHLHRYCKALDYTLQELFTTHLGPKPPRVKHIKVPHLVPNKELQCGFEGCDKPVYMAGYCFNHYRFHLLIVQHEEEKKNNE
jgi:transcriptional regulator with XRE-family HTH domain